MRLVVIVLSLLVACGDDSPAAAVCGNQLREAGESCDGDCPTACEVPGDPCQRATLLGSPAACDARCEVTTVDEPIADDLCCPAGASQSEDRDCLALCGNGLVEEGEACETALPGSCPTGCDDEVACTRDELAGRACTTVCRHVIIEAVGEADACCPSGAQAEGDPDCSPTCGNAAVEPGEACDVAIAAGGAGACPALASCGDGQACTVDSLASAGTCAAACVYDAIVEMVNDDGCCPPGGEAWADSDCVYW